MQLSHTRRLVSATFDEPNLVSAAGLVPLMALARRAGLRALADERMSVPTDKGANAGLKLSSLVAGMAAGADSIEDMALLRHGGPSASTPASGTEPPRSPTGKARPSPNWPARRSRRGSPQSDRPRDAGSASSPG